MGYRTSKNSALVVKVSVIVAAHFTESYQVSCVKVEILLTVMVQVVEVFTVSNSKMKISNINITSLAFYQWPMPGRIRMDHSFSCVLYRRHGWMGNMLFLGKLLMEWMLLNRLKLLVQSLGRL